MARTRYTPGPWKIGRLRSVGLNVFTLENSMSALEFVRTDWDANARLIAMAPEMYDALHIAAGFIAATDDGTSNPAYKIIEAVIAKAGFSDAHG